MKVSDEELQQAIKGLPDIKLIEGIDFANVILATSALTELEQHREERRWRTIDELSETTAPQFFQLSDGKSVNPMPFWLREGILWTWAEDPDGMGDVSIEMAQEWYTHFRPLPMDLPEVE